MTEKLKPCPCCKSSNVTASRPDDFDTEPRIVCWNCKLVYKLNDFRTNEDIYQELIQIYNHRLSESAPDEGELKGLLSQLMYNTEFANEFESSKEKQRECCKQILELFRVLERDNKFLNEALDASYKDTKYFEQKYKELQHTRGER